MSLPDGPKSPKIWQMLQWIAMPFSFMRGCSHRYGDRFTLSFFSRKLPPVVFFSNPQALQVILTSDDSELFDSPGDLNALLEPLIGTESVMGLSGDRHRRMRQLLMPSFHGERMRSYGQLIRDITGEVMSQRGAGESFPVRKFMQKISMRVILRAVFGVNEGTRYQQLERLLGTLLDGVSNPLSVSFLFVPMLRQDFGPLSPWGSFIRARRRIDQLIYDEIAERRTHPDASRNDILTLLMSARDEAGEALTDAELRDELITLLLAGHETTATAITWALYWIHKFPTVVVGCIYLAHRCEDVYPDPDEFRPERFLERHYSPFEYLPFGGGVRRCIGMAFAQFEMKLVISGILSGFELALADNRSVRPVRRGLTSGPSPFRMVVKEHRPNPRSKRDCVIG